MYKRKLFLRSYICSKLFIFIKGPCNRYFKLLRLTFYNKYQVIKFINTDFLTMKQYLFDFIIRSMVKISNVSTFIAAFVST